MGTCVICQKPLEPGDRRITWFTRNEAGEQVEHGAIHLTHIGNPVDPQ